MMGKVNLELTNKDYIAVRYLLLDKIHDIELKLAELDKREHDVEYLEMLVGQKEEYLLLKEKIDRAKE